MTDNDRWFMNAYLKILLPKAESAAGVSLIEHTMSEGFAVPLHVHNEEDETFYILEGKVRFKVGERTLEASPGKSLHVPGGTVHAFRIVSPIARFLTLSNGAFEDMVREASVQAEELALPPAAPFTEADQQMLAAICNRNGIEFVGPPIN